MNVVISMEIKKLTASEQDTIELATKLTDFLKPGDVVTLNGQLGAGKTTFTKGVAKGLGISQIISSPTFTIIKEYDNDIPLYHIDAYRLEFSEEDIGFEDYFYGQGVTMVEWSEFIEMYLPESRLDITINYVDDGKREFIFNPLGQTFEKRLEGF